MLFKLLILTFLALHKVKSEVVWGGEKCPGSSTSDFFFLNPFNDRSGNLTHCLSLANEKISLCSPGADILLEKVIMIFHHPERVRQTVTGVRDGKNLVDHTGGLLEAKCAIDQTRFCLIELQASGAMLIPPLSKGDDFAFQQMLLS